jgi:hypothetical protein
MAIAPGLDWIDHQRVDIQLGNLREILDELPKRAAGCIT